MTTSFLSELTIEERAVLDFVERYELFVADVAAGIPELQHCSRRQVERTVDGLVRRRALVPEWLYPGRKCFAVPRHREPTNARSRLHLSAECKIRRFAMISFCCLGAVHRTRLTPAEMNQQWPTPTSYGNSGCLYRQSTSPSIFGHLRVDLGGTGRWDRILAKCLQDARRLSAAPHLHDALAAEQVEVTIATALPQKAERLARALNGCISPLPIRIAVIPDLLNLIAPTPF